MKSSNGARSQLVIPLASCHSFSFSSPQGTDDFVTGEAHVLSYVLEDVAQGSYQYLAVSWDRQWCSPSLVSRI